MARTLHREASLSERQKVMAHETAWIARLHRIEGWVGGLLFAAGLVVWARTNSTGLLWAGLVLLFLHVGHRLKQQEHLRDAASLRIGAGGEHSMAAALETELPDDVLVWNDLVVRQGRDQAQIDHLVATPQGLFVIETKTWGRRVTGDANAPTWSLQGARDRRPRRVKNPLRQNRRQAAVLRALLAAQALDWPDVVPLVALLVRSPAVRIDGAADGLCLGVTATLEAIRAHRPRRTYSPDDLRKLEQVLAAAGVVPPPTEH